MTSREEQISLAAETLIEDLLANVQGDARELRDFAQRIRQALALGLLEADPDALTTFEARMQALLELTRVTAIKEQKEVILKTMKTGFKIASILIG